MSNENQHWVPKLLLKNFADAGRVYCLDIHSDEITKPPPKHAASERGFNDFEIDGRLVSFEGKLQKIETRAAPVLKRIIAAQNLWACRHSTASTSLALLPRRAFGRKRSIRA